MSVEIHEEAMMASPNDNSSSSVSNDHSPGIARGKRTKRQRQLHQSLSPGKPSSSTSSSGELSRRATEEEQDMANCLILLAQGRALAAEPKSLAEEEAVGGGGERFTSRRLAEATTTTNGRVGFYVYECKTCSKCFPSFQALGGHRASHKKPKMAPVGAVMAMEDNKGTHEDVLPITSIAPYPNPTILPNNAGGGTAAPVPMINSNSTAGGNKPRVHKCSICGSEFSSGQALGGHMRRHRAVVVAVPEPPQEAKKEKSILCLDLNLPAPMEDDRGDLPKPPLFPYYGKQPLIFTASPLVDCYY